MLKPSDRAQKRRGGTAQENIVIEQKIWSGCMIKEEYYSRKPDN